MAQLSEAGEIPGDEELNQMTMETMYDLMQDRLEEPEYGEAETHDHPGDGGCRQCVLDTGGRHHSS